jgi:hypothetical protein
VCGDVTTLRLCCKRRRRLDRFLIGIGMYVSVSPYLRAELHESRLLLSECVIMARVESRPISWLLQRCCWFHVVVKIVQSSRSIVAEEKKDGTWSVRLAPAPGAA